MSDPTEKPDLRNILKIEDRFAQYVGGGIVRWLDNGMTERLNFEVLELTDRVALTIRSLRMLKRDLPLREFLPNVQVASNAALEEIIYFGDYKRKTMP